MHTYIGTRFANKTSYTGHKTNLFKYMMLRKPGTVNLLSDIVSAVYEYKI